jgi:hypothetical protein
MTRLIRDQLPALSQRGRLRRLLSHIVFVLTVSTSSGTTTSFLPPFQSFRPITPIHKPGEVLAHVDGSVRVLRHQIVMRVRDDIDPRLPKRSLLWPLHSTDVCQSISTRINGGHRGWPKCCLSPMSPEKARSFRPRCESMPSHMVRKMPQASSKPKVMRSVHD